MTVKDYNHHPEESGVRYFVSLDPRLEEGWVYRAELRTGGRFDLINELGPRSPEVRDVGIGDYTLVELPREIYDRVVMLRGSGRDDAYSEAEALIRPFMSQGRDEAGMYLIESVSGKELPNTATTSEPFGPEFSLDEIDGIDAMEVWGTRFSAEGEDFVEFRLMRDGAVVRSRRVEGY